MNWSTRLPDPGTNAVAQTPIMFLERTALPSHLQLAHAPPNASAREEAKH
jgi:hypothetical protein